MLASTRRDGSGVRALVHVAMLTSRMPEQAPNCAAGRHFDSMTEIFNS